MRIRAGASAIAAVMAFAAVASAQDVDAGRKSFESRCARCHGADGNGGEMGPAIRERLPARDDKDLRQLINTGVPARGMPPTEMPSAEMDALVKFLRSIERRPESKPIVRTAVRMTDGKTLDGQLMGEGFDDMQVLGDDKRLHLFRRAGERYREVTSQNDWPTYNGDPRGNRYTTMAQITRDNVARLSPKWVFTIPGGGSSQATPSVVGGIMYVANPNECFALDAGTGRQIWRFQRPRSKAPTAAHANRGVSIAGDRLFMVSRRRASPRAEPVHGRAAVGHHARRLAQELRVVVCASRRGQSRRGRRERRRARRQRLSRRARSADRQGSLALLDGAAAR